MFIGTLKLNGYFQFIFGSLTVLFVLLTLGEGTGSAAITKIAGYEGIICGGSAVYTALYQILKELYARKA